MKNIVNGWVGKNIFFDIRGLFGPHEKFTLLVTIQKNVLPFFFSKYFICEVWTSKITTFCWSGIAIQDSLKAKCSSTFWAKSSLMKSIKFLVSPDSRLNISKAHLPFCSKFLESLQNTIFKGFKCMLVKYYWIDPIVN